MLREETEDESEVLDESHSVEDSSFNKGRPREGSDSTCEGVSTMAVLRTPVTLLKHTQSENVF